MKYKDLVSSISTELNVSKKNVDETIKQFIQTVQKEVLENKKEVRIPLFGKFIPRKIKGATGKKIGNFTVDIKENTRVAFLPFNSSYEQ